MAAPTLAMFGCGACKERFATREEMKVHFATPFHTYNAERKAKGFMPVDFVTYKALEPDEEEEPDRTPKFFCKICSKYYKSVQTLTMHLKSNQHVANKQKAIEDGASTVHSTASKFLLGSKSVSSKANSRSRPTRGPDGAPQPVPVLLIKDVPQDMTEANIHDLLEPWGPVDRVLFVRKRQHALVELPSVAAAAAVLAGCPAGSILFQETPLPIQYSVRESLGQDCAWCHRPGHTEEHCFLKGRSCTFCRAEGHRRRFCPRLPCVCCGSGMHTLEACEHRPHYDAVFLEMKTLRKEMHELVERARGPTDSPIPEDEDEEAGADEEDPPEARGASEPAGSSPPEGEAGTGDAAAPERRDWLQSCMCMFCDQIALTPEESAHHMLDVHSFRIPMPDIVADLYGLMSYLQRKVRAGLCLWCGEKTKYFPNIKALRQHMNHMGHRNINWTDNADEYADFYDMPESTACALEADEAGFCELPTGRVIASRGSHPIHTHRPGEFLMAGKENDLDRRRLLLMYKTHGALATNAAKKNLGKSQYHQLVRQDIALHNQRSRQWVKLAVDHNRAQFRGFMVKVSR